MVLLKLRVPLALLLLPSTVFAGPGGANVTHGNASVVTEGSTTTITNTPGTIINWQQFSVAPDEITRFVQQSASSTVLNRVTGSQGSEILGQLLSNGRVFLINPNGIAIGAGARIDTAGFVASSLNISDADFLSGRERFEGSGAEGRVTNRGSIDAGIGGRVYLIAPNVENDGVIRAPGGEILLAAGHSAELVSSSAPNLRVRISAPEGGAAVNVGELVAKAGRIGLFGAAVSAGGVLDASSASRNARGEIVLSAAGDTLVEAGARVDVGNAVGRGGSVLVEGARIAVLEGAVIDASGASGGGDVRVGGDIQGSGDTVRNASATVIAPSAVLSADALDEGDGGQVIVWSDDYTGFHGSISARGGVAGGDGGLVETSSAGNLQALGAVDASAPTGTAGQWLLDPYNITINTAASSNGTFNGGSPNLFTPTGNSAVANRDAIQASLNSGTSVTVSTGGTGSPGTQAGTLTVAAPIAKTAGGDATLSLNAASTISFTAGSTVTSTAGALGLSLATTGGAITNLPNINLNGGTLTLSSTATSTQVAGGVISGNTSVAKAGASAFQLRAGQTYTGTTTINGGSLQLTAANALPDSTAVTINSGTLNLANFSDTVGSIGGAGNVSLGTGTLTTGGNNASTALGGVISGAGSLVKNGTGTFTLGGNNTYTGATSINAGSVQLGAADRIANTSAVSVAAGATLALNNFNETLGSLTGAGAITLGSGTLTVGSGNVSSAFNGVISGTGGLTKGGTGTFTLGGANTWSGATSLTGGTLQLGGAERIADNSAVTLAAGTTLALAGFNESVGSLAGSGTVSLGAGTLTTGLNGAATTYSGVLAGTGTVTKLGAGTFTLSGVNTFTGALNVQAGILGFGSANRLTGGNAVTLSPGASLLLNNNSQTLGSLAGTGNVTLGSGTLTSGTNGGSTAYGGVISGTGGLAKSGTGVLTLTGANTYTGATTINAGTLQLGAAERLSNSTALNVLAGATFDLNGSSETVASIAGAGGIQLGVAGATLATAGTTTTAFSGVLAGTGNFTKGGTGTLTLSGANTYSGATQVNAGTLIAANPTALGGTATGTTVASGATLRVSNAAVGNENVTISGNGVANVGALTGDGTASLAGNVTLAAASRMGTTNAASTLAVGGTVDGAFALTPVGAGTVALNGVVGGTTPLASLSQGATTPMRIGTGSVTTTGAQAYAGPLTLASDVTLRSTANGAITLANVTGGGFDINALTGGATTLNNLTGVDVVATDAPGTVTLNGNVLASTITVGEAAPSVCGQVGNGSGVVTFAGAVSLCGTTTVSATDAQFNGAIDSNTGGARALTVSASGTTNFIGLVGATRALASLAVDGGGVTRFSAGSATQATVRTTGAQSYNEPVQLVATAAAQPRTFTSTGGGAIGFAGTVDAAGSGAANFTINTAGQTTLAGAVGASPLNTLTTDAAGTLLITAPSIRTVGAQLYGDAATQSGTTTFESTGNGDITLANAGNDLSTVGVTAARNVTLVDTNGLTLAGNTVSNLLSVNTGGALVQTGAISSPSLVAQAGGNAVLTHAGNDVDVLTLQSGGAASFTDADALSIAGLNATGVATVTSAGTLSLNGNAQASSLALRSSGADVVLGSGRSLLATGGGSSIVLDAAARFVNNGATLNPGPGRWVIYSADPALDVFGGLASGQVPVWGATSGTLAPALVPAGNRYVFAAGRTLTFTSTDTTKTYGDDASAALATAWTVSGFNSNTYGGAFLADNAASTFSGTPLLSSSGAVVTAPVAGAPYAIGISTGSLSALTGYSLAFNPAGLLYVNPRAANVIANNGTKIYGDVDPALTFTTTGFVNGDTPGGALSRVAGETVVGSPYAILQGTVANPNYTITYTGADFVITPRPITVVANPGSKVYGDVDPALTYAATGLLGSDSLSGALTRVAGESVGGSPYAILQGTLANANYTIAYTGADFIITPRPLILIANAGTKIYGDADPAFSYVATGLLGSDTLGGALTRAPGETVAGNPYAILQGTLANSNYTIAFTGADFVITPRSIGVTANPGTKIYGDADPAFTYVATGLLGSDTLSGALSRVPGEAVAGNPYTILQGSLANANYTIVYTGADFVITPRPITVVANAGTKVYGNADPALTYVAAGLIGSDSLGGVLARTPGEAVTGSPYAILQGTLANSNYIIAFTGADFVITPRPITVVANAGTKIYGDADPVLTYMATGLLGSDTLGGALTRMPGETVAGSPYGILQGTLANANYTIAYTGADFVITRRPISVVANPGTKIYGNADPVLTWVAAGLIGSDTLTGALTRVPGETVAGSPYAILQGTLANLNYTIVYTGANFVIARRPVQVVADNLSKEMGAADPALTYVATGLVGSDLLTGALVRRPGETYRSSPYLISQGTLTDAANPNYTIGYTPGYLTIEPGEVSPYSPVVEVGLERAQAQPFARSCLAAPEEDILVLGSEFTDAQERLDRASDGVRERKEALAICVTRAN